MKATGRLIKATRISPKIGIHALIGDHVVVEMLRGMKAIGKCRDCDYINKDEEVGALCLSRKCDGDTPYWTNGCGCGYWKVKK